MLPRSVKFDNMDFSRLIEKFNLFPERTHWRPVDPHFIYAFLAQIFQLWFRWFAAYFIFLYPLSLPFSRESSYIGVIQIR